MTYLEILIQLIHAYLRICIMIGNTRLSSLQILLIFIHVTIDFSLFIFIYFIFKVIFKCYFNGYGLCAELITPCLRVPYIHALRLHVECVTAFYHLVFFLL